MRQTFVKLLAGLLILATVSVGSAAAQTIGGQNPSGGPISPYLNLMRPATLPGINYYGLVQPQMQFQSAISGLQQTQANLIQGVSTGGTAADAPVMTGHAALFGNYSHYYRMGGALGGTGLGGVGTLPGARNLQNQMRMYSPLMGLGGYSQGTGLGGMNTSGMNPGVTRPQTPR